jgi:hypothetical protein
MDSLWPLGHTCCCCRCQLGSGIWDTVLRPDGRVYCESANGERRESESWFIVYRPHSPRWCGDPEGQGQGRGPRAQQVRREISGQRSPAPQVGPKPKPPAPRAPRPAALPRPAGLRSAMHQVPSTKYQDPPGSRQFTSSVLEPGAVYIFLTPHINNRPLKTILSYAKLKPNRRVASWTTAATAAVVQRQRSQILASPPRDLLLYVGDGPCLLLKKKMPFWWGRVPRPPWGYIRRLSGELEHLEVKGFCRVISS